MRKMRRIEQHRDCRAGKLIRRGLFLAAAAFALAGQSCESGPELVERIEAEAGDAFAREAVLKVAELSAVEGLVGEWMEPPVQVSEACSGPSVVCMLKGSGDKGEAYNRAIEIFLEVVESAKEMPLEGDVAAVIVEYKGGPGAEVRPMVSGSDLTGGDLVMTCLRDGRGQVRAAALGKVSGGPATWTVKALPKQTAAREFLLKPRYSWPDAGKAAIGEIRKSAFGAGASLDSEGAIRIPGGGESTVESVIKGLGSIRFEGKVESPRIVIDTTAGTVDIYGEASLDAANIRLGSAVRVVSGGPANDFAVVEAARDGVTYRIRTTRKIRDIVRVLDRMAVDIEGIERILRWAFDSKALAVEPLLRSKAAAWPEAGDTTLK